MRKVERIEPFLAELGELWKKNYPDWRFGQLISNFVRKYSDDPFDLEEDEFLVAMNAFVKGEHPKLAVYRYWEEQKNELRKD